MKLSGQDFYIPFFSCSWASFFSLGTSLVIHFFSFLIFFKDTLHAMLKRGKCFWESTYCWKSTFMSIGRYSHATIYWKVKKKKKKSQEYCLRDKYKVIRIGPRTEPCGTSSFSANVVLCFCFKFKQNIISRTLFNLLSHNLSSRMTSTPLFMIF